MPSYAYTALDARGVEVSDLLEAGSEQEAIAALRQAGYYPTSVLEAGKAAKAARTKATVKAAKPKAAGLKKEINISIPFLERKTIKPKTLMIFTRQLATLIDSGLPLLRGLTVLGKHVAGESDQNIAMMRDIGDDGAIRSADWQALLASGTNHLMSTKYSFFAHVLLARKSSVICSFLRFNR